MKKIANPSSFRDPSGFVFSQNNHIYRQINTSYTKNYDHLVSSGLYQELVDAKLLIPHTESDIDCFGTDIAYKVIQPEPIAFISYPYEWCFSQLKNAALATLEIQRIALNHGMSLKDCSAYNIQFRDGKPVFIDTLSFELYKKGAPWVAYKQFCQHFLAPLALMSYKDIRLNQLLRIYLDGIPLDLASSLLPFRTYSNFSLLSHIHLHARSQKHYADKKASYDNHKLSRFSFLALIDSLKSAVEKLKWYAQGTEWADYYNDTNYSQNGHQDKKHVIGKFLDKANSETVWDVGSNTGVFSRIASDKGISTVSFDIDPAAVETNYLNSIKNEEKNILPLVLDLTNPSSGIGWENMERPSWIERGTVDTVMALALIHHLAISNNIPILMIAKFFSRVCNKSLIIEFIPKNDSQVQRLLFSRPDIFPDYTQAMFENSFGEYFEIQNHVNIKDSDRVLYLMKHIG